MSMKTAAIAFSDVRREQCRLTISFYQTQIKAKMGGY